MDPGAIQLLSLIATPGNIIAFIDIRTFEPITISISLAALKLHGPCVLVLIFTLKHASYTVAEVNRGIILNIGIYAPEELPKDVTI